VENDDLGGSSKELLCFGVTEKQIAFKFHRVPEV
jgi:hypothetical protein